MAKGALSVDTEHLFPIIKKWLYSEKDIFIREVASNACDAITKHKRLISLGEAQDDGSQYRITIKANKDERTITVSDNGIGMNAEEVEKYINNIALSGAVEFISKYESENSSGIIGHFGLGFYSMFIIAEKVEMFTRSFKGGDGVHWICDGNGSFESESCEKEGHGTEIIMHVADDELSYLDNEKLKSILERYCAFMPYDIVLLDGDKEEIINDTCPLWQRNPSECTDEEYNEFYKKVFNDYDEPLFKVHIVADYPLNFKGILFIPRRKSGYDSTESEIKLFYNSVFVADNIKEACPEHLVNFKGVLDCPELPLNVSRSYLQNNTYVSKVSAHIVKKVADKLCSLCNTAREEYEKVWNDIRLFVEYACMRDRKFYDRVKDCMLLELTDGSYTTVSDYLEKAKETHENTVYYTSDKAAQAQYVAMFESAGMQVSVFDRQMDVQFLSMIESYQNEVKYVRIDADIANALKSDEASAEDKLLSDLFVKVSNNEKLKVEFTALKDGQVPVLLTISEESRRMEEMMKMYAMNGMGAMGAFPSEATLTVNTASPLIAKISAMEDSKKQEAAAGYLYELAQLSQRKLTAEELQRFLKDSYAVLEMI